MQIGRFTSETPKAEKVDTTSSVIAQPPGAAIA